MTIHAGEPGASIPAIRSRIDDAFGSRSFDHSGGTEVGAYGYSCEVRDGVHVNEEEFIAEVIDPLTGEHVTRGEFGRIGDHQSRPARLAGDPLPDWRPRTRSEVGAVRAGAHS